MKQKEKENVNKHLLYTNLSFVIRNKVVLWRTKSTDTKKK